MANGLRTYNDILDGIERLRARRRSMLLHRYWFGFVDFVAIDWLIGSEEAELDIYCNGLPF
jgi:hypothetical protein